MILVQEEGLEKKNKNHNEEKGKKKKICTGRRISNC